MQQHYQRSLFTLAALISCVQGSTADGSISSRREVPKLCESCLGEALETDYWGGTFGGEPLRVNAGGSMSQAEFRQLALSGRVLIIENASVDTAMAGWSCAKLAEEFPDAKMRREYDWEKNPDDNNLQKLGDYKWAEKTEQGAEHADRIKQDANAPPFAPFYWGVREHAQGKIGSKKVVKKIKGLIAKSVPNFMEKAGNADALFDNAEFWLGAEGTGARAHMDSHCISTLSVVMSGERRWRIGPVPRMPKGAGRSRGDDVLFDDGVAYKLGWKPMFEFTVKEGEAVLFPPGWIHETKNVAEGCTAALTTQFTNPSPVRYFRTYYQRLRRIGDLNPCWREMAQYASMGLKQKWDKMSSTDLRSFAESHFKDKMAGKNLPEYIQAFYDLDEDGKVSAAEFVDTFVEWVATEQAVRQEKQVKMPKPDMSLDVPSRDKAEL